jgi:glutathione S-transferase
MASSITLVTNKICPFAHRAWIAAREKGLDIELREVSLKNKEPYFTEIYHKAYAHDPSSDGKVPILIHGNNILAESDLVSWYISETFSTGTELIPKDIFQRAKMRHFIAEYPSKVIGGFYGFMGYHSKPKEAQQTAIEKCNDALQILNDRIVGPFVLGE